jgi:hypothetical protein
MEPENLFYAELLTQSHFNIRFCKTRIAAGGQQAGGCGEQCSVAIRFDAAALEDKVYRLQGRIAKCARVVQCPGDAIVETGGILLPQPLNVKSNMAGRWSERIVMGP